jgi:molybdenum cofactor guanylyltransferase
LIKAEEITGIVLAGGRSSRMGTDKALMEFRGKPLISYAIEHLSGICSQIIISSGQAGHGWKGHRTIPDETSLQAPLVGLYSCLNQSSTDWNMVVSCDMPFTDERLFLHLMAGRDTYDAVVPVNRDHFPEPLCALYHKRIRGLIKERMDAGRLGMQDMLKAIRTHYVDIDTSLDFYSERLFVNINTRQDRDAWS